MSASAGSIQVISTTTVKVPPQPQSAARINLTPWDLELLFLGYSQKGLLFLKPRLNFAFTNSANSLIHHLKASLHRTLHFFPPLAARLATSKSSHHTSFFIDCRGEGALFVHATVQMTVADVLKDTSGYVPEIVASFFPLTGVCNSDGISRPLLAVQVTELVDGLFIGCSINHLLADGTSFWHFINSWAEISRGNPMSKVPIFNRDQLTLGLSRSRTIDIPDELLIQGNNVVADSDSDSDSGSPLRERVFCFSKQSMAKLKDTANKQVKESNGMISSLQAVLAHVWRSILRCRFPFHSASIEETTLEIPMGARQRMHPPLPEEYFGNAVFPGIVTVEVGKILEKGLGWTAWQINRMVASANGPGKVRKFYTNWIEEPKFLQFDALPTNHFILINSPRFNVYGNDFGWGKPVAARSGRANRFNGRIIISGGGLEEGSAEIEACLCPETLSALSQDAEFMQFVVSSKWNMSG